MNLAGKGIKSNKLILCGLFGEHEAVHCGHVKSQRFAHSNIVGRAVINNTQHSSLRWCGHLPFTNKIHLSSSSSSSSSRVMRIQQTTIGIRPCRGWSADNLRSGRRIRFLLLFCSRVSHVIIASVANGFAANLLARARC